MEFTIRKCDIDDVEKLKKIAILTFRETFDNSNTEEDMKEFLDTTYNIEKLKQELRQECSLHYFAVDNNDDVLGFMKINWGNAQTEKYEDNALEVQRIYVSKESKGLGIGKALINKAFDRFKESSYEYIWLGVWENNYPAKGFYEKLGFKKFGKHTFALGNDRQTDELMKIDREEFEKRFA